MHLHERTVILWITSTYRLWPATKSLTSTYRDSREGWVIANKRVRMWFLMNKWPLQLFTPAYFYSISLRALQSFSSPTKRSRQICLSSFSACFISPKLPTFTNFLCPLDSKLLLPSPLCQGTTSFCHPANTSVPRLLLPKSASSLLNAYKHPGPRFFL